MVRSTLPLLASAFALLVSDYAAAATSVTSDLVLTGDHLGPITIDADDVTLDCGGYEVTGDGMASIGITVDGHTGVTLTGCYVSGFDTGLLVKNAGDLLVSNVNVTANPSPTDDGDSAIAVVDSTGVELSGCSANGAWHGYLVRGSEQVSLHDSSAYGTGGPGIRLAQSRDVTVDDNWVSNAAGQGIYVRTSKNVALLDNQIVDAGQRGVLVQLTDGLVMLGNTAYDSGLQGMVVVTSSNVYAQLNGVYGSGDDGFRFKTSTSVSLVANHAIGSAARGSLLEELTDVTLAQHTSVGSGGHGVEMKGLAFATITADLQSCDNTGLGVVLDGVDVSGDYAACTP